MIFGIFILLVALVISTVSAWYSLMGLAAIFPGAVQAIIIMGAALELGKITSTVWLHNNWRRIKLPFKMYLVPAIAVLMVITSMGIFGGLSKAHTSQAALAGDMESQVAILDEKIGTERDNIAANKKALQQLDSQVDQMLGRTTDEHGADRSVAIRRTQAKERKSLQEETSKSQANIVELQKQKEPLAAQVRKNVADVGPVLYIAELIYGDHPNNDLLERAVRWVIILLVSVFDPLALVLILAANQSFEWWLEDRAAKKEKLEYEPDSGPLTDEQLEAIKEYVGETPIASVSGELFEEPKLEIIEEPDWNRDVKDWTLEVKEEPLAETIEPVTSEISWDREAKVWKSATISDDKTESIKENIAKRVHYAAPGFLTVDGTAYSEASLKNSLSVSQERIRYLVNALINDEMTVDQLNGPECDAVLKYLSNDKLANAS